MFETEYVFNIMLGISG